MAWVAFHKWKLGQMDSNAQPSAPVDFDTDNIGILLLKSTAVSTSELVASGITSWQDVADAVASSREVTGSGYSRLGVAGVDATVDGSGNVKIDGSSISTYSQSSSGFADAQAVILYKGNSTIGSETDASSPLIAWYNLASTYGNDTGDLSLQFSATSGIFVFS